MALPSLSSIDALDHLARLGSIAAAADAMALTPGAISQKIKGLEVRLGYALTSPAGRGVALTPSAERYLEATRPALAAIRQAGAASPDAEARLTIAAPPGFAAHWLAPRLGDLMQAHPHLTLSLVRDGSTADVEIIFGETARPGEVYLATPQFFPVISPRLAYTSDAPSSIKSLAASRLLHLFDRRDWRDWSIAAGQPDLTDQADGLVFQDANMHFSAATAGLGVALGDDITCSAALRSGALVRLFSRTAPSRRSYFLKTTDGPAAEAFAGWLAERIG